MRRHRRALQTMDQINLTSLLDLTFVLLIAFMIVAPALQSQIKIKLPEEGKASIPGKTNNVIITIAKVAEGEASSRIYLTRKGKKDERVVDMSELMEALSMEKRRSAETQFSIEVDGEAPADAFVQVLGACQAAGIDDVAIPTKPPKDD